MKKIVQLVVSMALVLSCAIQANADADKQIELERRVDLLQKEVDKMRQDMDSPRGDIESDYLKSVMSQVKEHWFFPEDLEVKADDFLKVAIEIDRDGTITGQEIVESSGNDRFNSYAFECLEKSDPLPAMPEEMKKNSIEFELRFRPPKE